MARYLRLPDNYMYNYMLTNRVGDKLYSLKEDVSFDATVIGSYIIPLPTGKKLSVLTEDTDDGNIKFNFSADFNLCIVTNGCYFGQHNPGIYKTLISSMTGTTVLIYDFDVYNDDEFLNPNWDSSDKATYLAVNSTPVAKLKLANNRLVIQDSVGKDWYGFIEYSSND